VAHVGHDAAQRRRYAGIARHDAVGGVHLVHHGAHVQRAAAAERGVSTNDLVAEALEKALGA